MPSVLRGELYISCYLAKEATTAHVIPATATKPRHGVSSVWEFVQSGKLLSKILAQCTPQITMWHLHTKFK